jgi:hypothetical protein
MEGEETQDSEDPSSGVDSVRYKLVAIYPDATENASIFSWLGQEEPAALRQYQRTKNYLGGRQPWWVQLPT